MGGIPQHDSPNASACAAGSGEAIASTVLSAPTSGRELARGPREAMALSACVSACGAAYGVYFGLPLILVALASTYGFSNPDLGWISAAEGAGLLLGAVGVSLLARWRSYKVLVAIGIGIAVVADIATLGISGVALFCAIRLLAGFGSGLCYSAAIGALSRTSRVDRSFSILAAVLVVVNSLDLWLVPNVGGSWGIRGVYLSLACLYLLPALLLRYVPGSPAQDADQRNAPSPARAQGAPSVGMSQELRRALEWQCLLAVILFNLAASAFYAYSGRIGTSSGLSEHSVSIILTLCNLISGTGSMLAYALSRRWGQHRPQLAALTVMFTVFLTWALHLSALTFMIGTLLFFEVWTIVVVFQLGTLSNIDGTGRKVALIPAAQGIGQSAGPFVAAGVLAMNFSFSQMLLGASLFAAGSFGLYAAVYARLRRVDGARL